MQSHDSREKWRLWEDSILSSGRAAQEHLWEAERLRLDAERDADLARELALKRHWQTEDPPPMPFWAVLCWVAGVAGFVALLCWELWGW